MSQGQAADVRAEREERVCAADSRRGEAEPVQLLQLAHERPCGDVSEREEEGEIGRKILLENRIPYSRERHASPLRTQRCAKAGFHKRERHFFVGVNGVLAPQ